MSRCMASSFRSHSCFVLIPPMTVSSPDVRRSASTLLLEAAMESAQLAQVSSHTSILAMASFTNISHPCWMSFASFMRRRLSKSEESPNSFAAPCPQPSEMCPPSVAVELLFPLRPSASDVAAAPASASSAIRCCSMVFSCWSSFRSSSSMEKCKLLASLRMLPRPLGSSSPSSKSPCIGSSVNLGEKSFRSRTGERVTQTASRMKTYLAANEPVPSLPFSARVFARRSAIRQHYLLNVLEPRLGQAWPRSDVSAQ
mmetsp:Transcript_2946/g.8303  ORF Transcript_2946/g.8303 Transcript_2946/m.8303 type:complete len:256 (-) Transcript_2946:75-842(-)